MRLIKAYINEFRRFEEATIDLDCELLAIVGPNEAGKSSLLAALMSTKNDQTFKKTDITRTTSQSKIETSIKLLFLLNKEEQQLAKKFNGIGEPRWYIVQKDSHGLIHWVKPEIKRDITLREKALNRIEKILANPRLEKTLSKVYEIPLPNKPEQTINRTLRQTLQIIQQKITTDTDVLPENVFNSLNEGLDLLRRCYEELSITNQRILKITEEILENLIEFESRPNPESELLNELDNQQPEFLLFDDHARSLLSEYAVQDLDNPPAALQNLFDLAGLQSSNLKQAIDSNNHGRREALIEDANRNLQEKFKRAWKQSPVFVRLQVDPEVIRILVKEPETYSDFGERSDGLKAFVALFAFTSIHANGPGPILLIDEADAHLHYDAQAELIRVFELQDIASKIIYTTHSAGCLPYDLGKGIRVVKPIYNKNGQDKGRSTISNSFWTEGAGFSPLMLAMGASIMALIPTRRAVITEGPSDVILLPTLFRNATQLEKLDFQVAPGLANISPIHARELILEAPVVAYLLDGDKGGKKNRSKLKKAGIPNRLILDYGTDRVIEDFLDIDLYVSAINEELRRSYGNKYLISKDDIKNNSRPSSVKVWCDQNGITVPNKLKIALHVLDLCGGNPILNLSYKKFIKQLYKKILNVLQPDSKLKSEKLGQ